MHESNYEETSDKVKLRFILVNSLQKCQCHENQGKMKDCFRLKEIKDTWQNVMWFWTESFCYKGHYWNNCKNLNGVWGLGTRNVSVLIFQHWWLCYIYVGKKFLVGGNIYQGVNEVLGENFLLMIQEKIILTVIPTFLYIWD